MKKVLFLSIVAAICILAKANAKSFDPSTGNSTIDSTMIKDPILKILRSGGKEGKDGVVRYGTTNAIMSDEEWGIECIGKGIQLCEFISPWDQNSKAKYQVMKVAIDLSDELFNTYRAQKSKEGNKHMNISIYDESLNRTYYAELTELANESVAIVVTIVRM